MENNNFKFDLSPGVNEVIIREGQALELKDPVKVVINGIINAPRMFIEFRKTEYDSKKAHLLVDKLKMTIALRTMETDFYGTAVSGSLKINPELKDFEINNIYQRSAHDLAEFIKMNRYFFKSTTTAMKLVSELMNFEATVDKEIKDKSDNRANITQVRNQVVTSNIPEAFTLNIPVFVGQDAMEVKVEININASTLECSLISPELIDIIRKVRDEIIDNEIKEIRELDPELLIIEV